MVQELRTLFRGWWGYYGFTEVTYIFKEVDSWIRRRLRCHLWKQWGRRRHREVRRRGIRGYLIWNTVKSARGPWRLGCGTRSFR